MRKLILKMSVTIDGFVGGPNGELDWIFKTLGEDATAWTVDQLWQAGAQLMGRTFHDMAAYWPSSTEAFAAPMNDISKIVFSRKGFTPSPRGDVTVGFDDAVRLRRADGSNTASTLPPSAKTWAEAIVASGDMTQEVMKLKKAIREGSDRTWGRRFRAESRADGAHRRILVSHSSRGFGTRAAAFLTAAEPALSQARQRYGVSIWCSCTRVSAIGSWVIRQSRERTKRNYERCGGVTFRGMRA